MFPFLAYGGGDKIVDEDEYHSSSRTGHRRAKMARSIQYFDSKHMKLESEFASK